jgi:hypothetical protein
MISLLGAMVVMIEQLSLCGVWMKMIYVVWGACRTASPAIEAGLWGNRYASAFGIVARHTEKSTNQVIKNGQKNESRP